MNKSNDTSRLPYTAIPQPVPSWLQNFTPLLQQARWFSNNDQDKEALALALEEYKRQPSLDALEQVFDSYMALKQFDKAKALFKEMKKLGATDAFLELQKSNYYIAVGKLTNAQRCVKQVLLHKKQLDKRCRASLYSIQGLLGFSMGEPSTLPFTQALRYDYLLMPQEIAVCYLIRGRIRLDQEEYEAAYQDAQSCLRVYPNNEDEYLVHYLRAAAGYGAGRLTYVKQDIEIVLQSRDKAASEEMKPFMQELQELLPKEPVVIDKDFMENLQRQFFGEVDDVIDAAGDFGRCATWTGALFKEKMDSGIQKSIAYLRESLAPLNKPGLPEELKEIQDYLQRFANERLTQICLDFITPTGPETTLAQMQTWKKQILLILDEYTDIYESLCSKVKELAVLYYIPAFFGV